MFFYVLMIVVVFEVLLLISKIRISIKNFRISTEHKEKRLLNKNYKIIVSLRVTKNINLLKLEITKEKLEKLELKSKLEKINIKKIKFEDFEKNKIKEIKKYKPQIKYINLRADIGFEDAVLTSYANAVVSTVLGILLRNQICNLSNSKFIINPVFENKNIFKMELDCIFEIKMIHIIYIIYILSKKRRSDKNGRTSNRRTYDYSYE